MQAFIAFQAAFLFRNWEMTIWTSSVRFVQILVVYGSFYALGMVETWGPQHFPVIIPYLPRTKPVLSNLNKTPAFKNP